MKENKEFSNCLNDMKCIVDELIIDYEKMLKSQHQSYYDDYINDTISAMRDFISRYYQIPIKE